MPVFTEKSGKNLVLATVLATLIADMWQEPILAIFKWQEPVLAIIQWQELVLATWKWQELVLATCPTSRRIENGDGYGYNYGYGYG